MNPSTARCRLCYDLKPFEELVDLQSDENQKRKVLGDLKSLKLQSNGLGSAENDGMPKTVCSECTFLLNDSYQFSVDAEKAQKQLRYLLCSFGPECAGTRRQ